MLQNNVGHCISTYGKNRYNMFVYTKSIPRRLHTTGNYFRKKVYGTVRISYHLYMLLFNKNAV